MLTTTRSLALAAAAGLPCFVAAAQHDAVLDRVPGDTAMVVSISNLSDVLDGAQAFAQAAKLPEMNMGVGMARGMLGMPGINATGSAAVVFSSLEGLDRGGEDNVVLLVPVTDYGAFAQGFGGTGDGLESVEFQGENVSMKDAGGGYAVVGPMEGTVGAFTAAEGAWAQHQAAMGARGNALAGDHSIVVSVAVEAFAETMLEAWAEGAQQMQQFAQMGGQGDQIGGQIELFDQVVKNFARDGERGIVAITLDGRGVSLDLGANFKAGSELAAFFAESNGAADTFAKLPGGEFIAAFAVDMTGAGIRELMNNMSEAGEAMNQGMPGMDFTQFMDNADSMAQVIGYNPAGLMGGIFPYTTMLIETANADALIQGYGESVAAMNDQEANGMLLTSSFDDAPSDVGGIQAYGWSIGMMPDMNDPNAMQMQMMLPMLFGGGANGPSGYVAAADDSTVVMTYTRTGDMLSRAVSSAREGGDLVSNELLAAQAERLPAGSFMLGYVDFGTIARSALPMVGMFAPEAAAIQVPDALTPVAFAASAEGGSMSFRTVVPMDLISTVKDIVESFDNGGGGGGGGGGQPEF